MDTLGHEKVAETAGIPLLKEAFPADRGSLQAFYLGNWLTDVSQFVDPVGYECGLARVETLVSEVIDRAVGTTFRPNEKKTRTSSGLFERVAELLETFSEDANRSIVCSIEAFASIQANPRESLIAKFFRDAFFVIGYFKFVHPDVPGGELKMEFTTYADVFNGMDGNSDNPGAFSQYVPIEHLDRPEVRLCTGEYAPVAAKGGGFGYTIGPSQGIDEPRYVSVCSRCGRNGSGASG